MPPIITGPAGYDPALGEMRTVNVNGGTAADYTFNSSEFTVGIAGLVSLNQVPGSKLDTTMDIVNVSGASVTLQPNTAYKIYATSQAITLNANPPAAGKWAYDGHLEIFTAGTGYVMTGTNVVLANALEPDSVNNCTVRFHDGIAIIAVEDHVAGYIVVNGSTSGAGSLYYGITTSTNDYVAFDASLNGTTIPLAGATAEGEKHIVGNGYTETAITGAVDCGTSKFTVANLGLNNVQVAGGVMTLGDAYIPSGSTVAVSGGGLAIEKVTGAGSDSVIDLGGTHITGVITASNVMFTGGSAEGGAALGLGEGNTVISNCEFRNNIAGANAAVYYDSINASAEFDNCLFTSNKATNNVCIADTYMSTNSERAYRNCTFTENNVGSNVITLGGNGNSLPVISGCVFSSNAVARDIRLTLAGSARVKDCTFADNKLNLYPETNCAFSLAGSNSMQGYCNGNGSVSLTSGAILDLTGNTNAEPIAPGGGITFKAGGATVLYSSGAVSGSYIMDNVTLPAGAKLTNTAVVDLNGTQSVAISSSAVISGATITGGSASQNSQVINLLPNAALVLDDSAIEGNTGANRGVIVVQNNASVTIQNSTIGVMQVFISYGDASNIAAYQLVGYVYMNSYIASIGPASHVIIASGTTVDCTGFTHTAVPSYNTVIDATNGYIVVQDGVSVVPKGGGTPVPITAGTYSKLYANGTIE